MKGILSDINARGKIEAVNLCQERVLWQAEVADWVSDLAVKDYLLSLPLDDFCKILCGGPMARNQKTLARLYLLHAVYCHWAKASQRTPVYELRPSEDGPRL